MKQQISDFLNKISKKNKIKMPKDKITPAKLKTLNSILCHIQQDFLLKGSLSKKAAQEALFNFYNFINPNHYRVGYVHCRALDFLKGSQKIVSCHRAKIHHRNVLLLNGEDVYEYRRKWNMPVVIVNPEEKITRSHIDSKNDTFLSVCQKTYKNDYDLYQDIKEKDICVLDTRNKEIYSAYQLKNETIEVPYNLSLKLFSNAPVGSGRQYEQPEIDFCQLYWDFKDKNNRYPNWTEAKKIEKNRSKKSNH